MEKSGKRHHRRRPDHHHTESVISNTPSTSTAVQTPSPHDDGDKTPHDVLEEDMQMTIEEAMDMESDDESDVDTGGEDEGEDEDEEARVQEKVGLLSMGPPDRSIICLEDRMDNNEMDVDAPPIVRPMELPLPQVGITLENALH